MTTAYLAPDGLEPQLREELQRAGVAMQAEHGRLLVADRPAIKAAWAANIWHDCVEWPVASIGTAAKGLRDIQRNWAMYAPLHHRRAALIQERLPHVSAKPIVFPGRGADRAARLVDPARAGPAAGGGALQSSPFPNGEVSSSRTRPARPTAPISSCGRRWCGCAAGRSRASAASISAPRRAAGPGCWPSSAPTVVADRQGAARSAHRGDAGRRMARRECVRSRTRKHRAGRLAVLRHRLLSGAAAAAGRALAGVGAGEEFRLHHQVPGRDRPRRRRRRSPRCRGRRSCICTTTSTS